MKIKSFAVAAALVAASFAASANTTITPVPNGDPNTYSADFGGYASVNTFDLDLTSFVGVNLLDAQVTANFTKGKGYDVTGVTFDGVAFTPLIDVTSGKTGSDLWEYNLGSVTSAMHTIVVTGVAKGGSTVGFTGSLGFEVTPVPEPETYGMLLAGLGLVGFMARRKKAA